jgi:hypothetical protein
MRRYSRCGTCPGTRAWTCCRRTCAMPICSGTVRGSVRYYGPGGTQGASKSQSLVPLRRFGPFAALARLLARAAWISAPDPRPLPRDRYGSAPHRVLPSWAPPLAFGHSPESRGCIIIRARKKNACLTTHGGECDGLSADRRMAAANRSCWPTAADSPPVSFQGRRASSGSPTTKIAPASPARIRAEASDALPGIPDQRPREYLASPLSYIPL